MEKETPPISSSNPSTQKYRKAFWILLLVTTGFRLFYIQWVQLAPDEAYYFTWSRHLQWGYYDHPPMVGLLIWIGTLIGRHGEFGVRLPWVLIGALLSLLLYRLGTLMFQSERVGFYSALLMNISLLSSAGTVIATPDAPQVLFWGMATLFLFQATQSDSRLSWYLTGLSLGLGLLSKYTMILFVPCVFLFLLFSSKDRKWLRRKEPYLAFVLGLLIFSPVILWNAHHQWISFRMQLAHGLGAKPAAGLMNFASYWGGQALLLSPFVFLAIVWALVMSAFHGFRRRQRHLLLLFWTSAPVILFFALTSLRSKVEANWPALAYFSAVIAFIGLASEAWRVWKRVKRGLFLAVAVNALLFTILGYLQPLYPLIPIASADDPTSQLYGWDILGNGIQEVAKTMGPGKEIFLLTPRHQLVGEGMFYTQGKFRVYQWDAPWRINNLSAVNQPEIGSRAIFFTEEGDALPQGLDTLFSSCSRAETIVVQRNGLPMRTHPIWVCEGFKGMK